MPERILKGGEEPVAIALSVGNFPDYLSRSQIVTRSSDNRLQLAPFDHWAEPIRVNFNRVLLVDLSNQLGTDRIYYFPWKKTRSVDYEVLVDVARFDGELGGDVVLFARLSIFDAKGREELVTQSTRVTASAEAKDYEAQVAAMSRAVGELSRKIAESIKELRQGVRG
jgi:uncharacterized lipoprotein YmbA